MGLGNSVSMAATRRFEAQSLARHRDKPHTCIAFVAGKRRGKVSRYELSVEDHKHRATLFLTIAGVDTDTDRWGALLCYGDGEMVVVGSDPALRTLAEQEMSERQRSRANRR